MCGPGGRSRRKRLGSPATERYVAHCYTPSLTGYVAVAHDARTAARQLRRLSTREQRILEAAILSRLEHLPTTSTKAIQRLRPNPLAEFELRAGDLRALYNVEGDEVVILILGRKVGNTLIVARSKASPRKPFASGTGG